MASKRPRLAIPTPAPVSNTQRLSSTNPAVLKSLIRLSRQTLISLVLDWLSDENQSTCAPYLAQPGAEVDDDDDDDIYPTASSLEELREVYYELQKRKGGKREVVSRISECDWRQGLTLYQLAMVDTRYLLDHPMAHKWTALKLEKQKATVPYAENAGQTDKPNTPCLPRFHLSTFLRSLQREIGSIVKAHYYFIRPKSLPLMLLRIRIFDSPYNRISSSTTSLDREAFKTVYVAFPNATPHIYISLGAIPMQSRSASEGRSLRDVALPKAMSRPQARYKLHPTSLSARSLPALLSLRGAGRGNAAAGGWSVFADGSVESTPLDYSLPRYKQENLTTLGVTAKEDEEEEEDEADKENANGRPRALGTDDKRKRKRRELVAQGRFGTSAKPDDGKGIERFEVHIHDRFTISEDSTGADQVIGRRRRRQSDNLDTMGATGSPRRRRRGRPSRVSQQEEAEGIPSEEATGETPNNWTPRIQITFQGSHVFAGMRKLVEAGAVDGERMPGWMTGEAGVSVGVVRDGRIRGQHGQGL
ncbi:MAG: hypothetical protein M1825_006004 [Sarcosagium campestre]|nr:MAG: hypothetical protein M1825_006004 [Sarcosagium campestre]